MSEEVGKDEEGESCFQAPAPTDPSLNTPATTVSSSPSSSSSPPSTTAASSGLGPYEQGPRAVVVIVAFFFMGMVEMGIVKCFGVLVDDLIYQLDTTSGTIGFIIGLQHGMAYALAPFIAPLSQRKSAIRPAMLGGSALLGIAISLSSFTPSVASFAVTMVISGVGFSVVSFMTVTVFSAYFHKRFALAFGISDMGCALSMVLPLGAERFLEWYGWRGAILLTGGIAFHTVAFCALMRDPRTLRKRRGKKDHGIYSKVDDNDCDQEGTHGSRDSLTQGNNKTLQSHSWKKAPGSSLTNDNENQIMQSDTNSPMVIVCASNTERYEGLSQEPRDGRTHDDAGSLKVKTCSRLRWACLRPLRWIWSVLDWSLCRDEPYLNFIFLTSLVYGMVSTAWYIFLVPHTVARGIPLSRAVLVSLFSGVGGALGRFGQGPIIHRGLMTSLGLFMLLALFNSTLFFLDPILTSFELLAGASFVNGVFFGAQTSLTMVMLKDTTTPARFHTSYGLSCLLYGISEPFGGFLAGFVASKLGYDMTFIFLGGLSLVNIPVLLPAYCRYSLHGRRRHGDVVVQRQAKLV